MFSLRSGLSSLEAWPQTSEAQCDFQKWGSSGGFGLGDFFGGALGDDLASGVTGFGADVEDPVGLGGDGHVVLDDDDGVAFIDDAVEDVDEVEVALAEGGVVEGGLHVKRLSRT
jgi:hypothetical protein